MAGFLIYGANGYTGELITREAAARGLCPILAGRNAESLAVLGRKLHLEHRVFPLDDPAAIDRNLHDVQVVLHCAGPFVHTAKPMADACLRSRIHYLDITGEIGVFEELSARDGEAKAAEVMLLPGAGFDVVPTDCLALYLKQRLPSATKLVLAIWVPGSVSRGTARTIADSLPRGGCVRCGGVLTPVPTAWKMRGIDFGMGAVKAVSIPWGDVSTAYHSTGIPNIEVYLAMPWGRRFAARLGRYLGWLLGSAMVQRVIEARIRARPPGPTSDERLHGSCILWGEATDEAGRRVVSRLRCSEGYTMTVQSALAVMDRVLAGELSAGYQTPARVYGPDFVLGIAGVVREDVDV